MLTKKTSVDDRIVILGASRGLGWALYQEFLQRNMESLFFIKL